jgi:GTP-binding protein EngB required for normal cell division
VRHEGLNTIICLNKIDLVDCKEFNAVKSIYQKAGYKVIATSPVLNIGIDELRDTLRNNITVFSGPSGVGKSSLLNQVQPNLQLKTGEISDKTKRGKHTTRHVELLELDNGGYVLDTPGFSSLDIDFIDNEIEYVSTVGKTLQLNGSIDKFSRFIRNKVIIPANFTGDNLVELGILVYAVSNFLVSDNDFINYSTTSLKLFTASTPLYGKPNRINGNITNRYNATKGYLNGDIYNVTVGIGDIPVGETKSSTPGYIKAFGITFKNKVVATPLFDTKGLIITTRIDEVNEGVILDVYNPTTASVYFEGSFNISIE